MSCSSDRNGPIQFFWISRPTRSAWFTNIELSNKSQQWAILTFWKTFLFCAGDENNRYNFRIVSAVAARAFVALIKMIRLSLSCSWKQRADVSFFHCMCRCVCVCMLYVCVCVCVCCRCVCDSQFNTTATAGHHNPHRDIPNPACVVCCSPCVCVCASLCVLGAAKK